MHSRVNPFRDLALTCRSAAEALTMCFAMSRDWESFSVALRAAVEMGAIDDGDYLASVSFCRWWGSDLELVRTPKTFEELRVWAREYRGDGSALIWA